MTLQFLRAHCEWSPSRPEYPGRQHRRGNDGNSAQPGLARNVIELEASVFLSSGKGLPPRRRLRGRLRRIRPARAAVRADLGIWYQTCSGAQRKNGDNAERQQSAVQYTALTNSPAWLSAFALYPMTTQTMNNRRAAATPFSKTHHSAHSRADRPPGKNRRAAFASYGGGCRERLAAAHPSFSGRCRAPR